MSGATFYSTALWREVVRPRVIARDGNRCTVSRLLGGDCSRDLPLHVHHIVRPEDGGALYDDGNLATVCARHHPRWEALRRQIAAMREPVTLRCPHAHRSREAREICERRLARERQLVA